MKKRLFLLVALFSAMAAISQPFVIYRGDTMIIHNKTKDSTGAFLKNINGGKTQFYYIKPSDIQGFAAYIDSVMAANPFSFSLTTLGTSGPATYNAGVLNIPNYAASSGSSVPALVKMGDANYTVTGTGNVAILVYSTLTANRTITLPDPATAINRVFSVSHNEVSSFDIIFNYPIYDYDTGPFTGLSPGSDIKFLSDGTQYVMIK
jgi:hypothetical protein